MAKEKNFAQEILKFQRSLIGSQKTLLSEIRELLPFDELILDVRDVSRKPVPKVAIIVGDSLSIVFDALEYMNEYFKKFGCYPKVVALPGVSSSKYVDWGMPVEDWIRTILVDAGIPKENILSFDCISKLDAFLEKRRYKYASVFAPRGFNVSAVISLNKAIPNIKFKFFVKHYMSKDYMKESQIVSNCQFDTDKLSSIEMDLLLGQIVRLNMIRDSLPENLRNYLMSISVASDIIQKGYILGLNTREEILAAGLTEEQFGEMLPKRLADFEWLKDPKNRIYNQMMSLME